MSSSEERAIRAVEVGIIAQEGLMTVDGTPFTSYIQAELARHALAERAVTEASLLRRYIRVEPPCTWCGCAIKPNRESREIGGRLLHDTDGGRVGLYSSRAGGFADSVSFDRPIH